MSQLRFVEEHLGWQQKLDQEVRARQNIIDRRGRLSTFGMTKNSARPHHRFHSMDSNEQAQNKPRMCNAMSLNTSSERTETGVNSKQLMISTTSAFFQEDQRHKERNIFNNSGLIRGNMRIGYSTPRATTLKETRPTTVFTPKKTDLQASKPFVTGHAYAQKQHEFVADSPQCFKNTVNRNTWFIRKLRS